jgi:hypothetical protein
VTGGTVGWPFMHVTADERGRLGVGGHLRGDGGAACKTAGFAYTGSNPVPATLP